MDVLPGCCLMACCSPPAHVIYLCKPSFGTVVACWPALLSSFFYHATSNMHNCARIDLAPHNYFKHPRCGPTLSSRHGTRCMATAKSRAKIIRLCVMLQTAARVWDALLNEGPKVLFRVALALLKTTEAVLLKQDNVGLLLREVRQAVTHTHDRDKLMKVGAFAFAEANLPCLHCNEKLQCPVTS